MYSVARARVRSPERERETAARRLFDEVYYAFSICFCYSKLDKDERVYMYTYIYMCVRARVVFPSIPFCSNMCHWARLLFRALGIRTDA